VKRATTLIHSLLSFARNEVSIPTVVDPAELMSEIQELIRHALRAPIACARYTLGDDPPALFERLLLPASEDGLTVSHIFGMINITDISPLAHVSEEP
jgi:signal transduction histidine kinase